MLIEMIYATSARAADFTQANPPAPEPEHPALKVGLGLGFASLWLVGLLALGIGLTLFLPKLFRQPPHARASE